jgi:hypothetical protein
MTGENQASKLAHSGKSSDFENFYRKGAKTAKETQSIFAFTVRSLRLRGEY